MCEVTSFCCGCADLRKGALIIGSLNLFFAVIQVAYNGYLLIAVQVNLASEKTPTEHAQVIIQEVYQFVTYGNHATFALTTMPSSFV